MFSNRPIVPQRYKVFVIILVLSNIGVGSFAFYTLRSLDRKYSALLSSAVPALNDLQTLTALSVEAMHRTNPSFIGSAGGNGEMIERARHALRNDRELRHRLLSLRLSEAEAAERSAFEDAGHDFTRVASDLVEAIAVMPSPEINRQREEIVRPAFDRYLEATTKLADAVEAGSRQDSKALTVKTGALSRVILAAANWPLAILFLVVSASLILIFVARNSLFMGEGRSRL